MNEHISRIQEAARRILPHAGSLHPHEPRHHQNGEIWETHSICNSIGEEVFRVLILEAAQASINGQFFHLAAPILTETHLAGPTDFILCQNILGHRAMVALGEAFTIAELSIASCPGMLPKPLHEDVMRAFGAIEQGGSLDPTVSGPEYLDEYDIRYRFHAELSVRLAPLQAAALSCLDGAEKSGYGRVAAALTTMIRHVGQTLPIPCPQKDSAKPLIFWPSQPDADEYGNVVMAASDNRQTPLRSETWGNHSRKIRLSISDCRNRSDVAIEVIDGEALVEGVCILDESGDELGRISGGAARITSPRTGFRFVFPNGSPLRLSKEPEQP